MCEFYTQFIIFVFIANETTTDVTVLVRSSVVTIQVEQPIIRVLVVVTAYVQHNSTGVVVAVVIKETKRNISYWYRSTKIK